ncbi:MULTISPECIES: cytochrome c oxidase, cbb3-type, CcoQ subunit [Campylobacter]|uniref:Cytochrome c oxidase, cbb3-type, CcoQ subunit n=1 Tax=Campylobacter taeniopygiae TaxID=2510188 RepID=A0ABY2TKQ0_9BACT|nr:cytochrome c oxidase, cbb3-type, CcoQ subunit [Campylobacter taeniopygiae]MBZ7935324.1 cytochrome c oxidase, cbb3-type, CcoQ subunit [Campylobacter sp. B0100352/1]MBZ7963822.1 cytochrome c oxidase, cbb3-type, CcoQ subunit [Campylobacter sp. 2457A]TKX34694.1 cytochrome c oxidase, cbb3-type, CcoQ subunit [Campylobacter taeniopygiae]
MEHLLILLDVIKKLTTLNLSEINQHEWRIFQAYGFFLLVVFLSLVLYSYLYHLYRAEKNGERNYEKYANLVLDDSINDSVLENKRSA